MTVTVTGGLITLDYALTGLNYGVPLPPGDGSVPRDADIIAYIQSATPVIESLVGPVLQKQVTQRRDGGKTGVAIAGPIANAAAVTAVRVAGAPWSGYVVDPDAGIVYAGAGWTGMVFPVGSMTVEIDVTVGYATIPQNLQLATRELVRHWIQIGKQAQAGGALNQLPDASADPLDPYAIPRRVRQLCGVRGGGFA